MYELENNRWTQECGENHLYDPDCPDILPEQDPELPPKEDASYDKVFVCDKSEFSHRELEPLPEPFDTCHATDEQTEQIVFETEMETCDRLRLGDNESTDFDDDRHNEV